MRLRRRTRLLLFGLSLLLVLLGAVCWWQVGSVLWRQSRPLTTVVRMRDLMGVLQADALQDVGRATLEPLLAQSNRSECLFDGWGRPFLVTAVTADTGSSTYRVVSLGADGRQGACCQRWVESFEEDALLEGERWLQQWTFGRTIVATQD